MKKIFVGLVAMGMALNSIHAQEIKQLKHKHWGIGIEGGINCSTPIWVPAQYWHFSPQYNLLAGIDVNYQLNQRSSFHLQPAWTKVNDTKFISPYSSSSNYSISTVKLPFLYRHRILSTKVSPFVEIGAGYNQIVNSNYRTSAFSICDPGPCPTNEYFTIDYALTNKSAMSVIGGIGVDINLKMINIPISVRYERYLNDYTFSTSWFNPDTKLRFENIALMTGINF